MAEPINMMMDCMFDMEDDYGFYEDIDISDRSAAAAAVVAHPTPTMSGLSADDVTTIQPRYQSHVDLVLRMKMKIVLYLHLLYCHHLW